MAVKLAEEVSSQVPADDFQVLEEKVYRTIEMYKTARQGQLTAEKEVEKLKRHSEERDAELMALRREAVQLRKDREEVRVVPVNFQ